MVIANALPGIQGHDDRFAEHLGAQQFIQAETASRFGLIQALGLMPTLIANVYAEIEVVLEALSAVGLSWRNPSTNDIYVWSGGERLVVESEASAVKAWRSGCLLQLWRDEANDLAIGRGESCVCLFFDGCSAREVAIYLSPLLSRSIRYWVGPDV